MLIICNVLSHDLGILYLQIQFPAMIILSQQWPLFQDLEMGRCYTVNVSCTPGQWLGWIGDLEATKGSSLLPLLQFKNHYGCIFVIYFMHICVYLHVSVCTMCVPAEVSREHWIPSNWSSGWLWETMWVLGTRRRSSAGAASALTCRVISPVPPFFSFWWVSL